MNSINIEALGNPSSLQNNSLELHDFMDGANFDQLFNLIRENDQNPIVQFDCHDHNHPTNGCLTDTPADLFGFNANNVILNDELFPSSFEGGNKEIPEEDIRPRDDDSPSGTSVTTPSKSKRGKKNGDSSRTLISERRRRGRMKEKLYALRALVPNISKMDKASIVGDALQYVKELQMQAKKLTADIAGLEASLLLGTPADRSYQGYNNNNAGGNTRKMQMPYTTHIISKKLIQMDVFQVEERGFYVKLVCNNGGGAAASLYKVLESLIIFNVQNSNLATASDQTLVLTFNLKVKECEQDINLPNLKLWVISALLNEGFVLI